VSLGANAKQFIAFSTVILRLGYQPIKDFLLGAVHLAVSDGEITETLADQAASLQPEFAALRERIDRQPASHYDETSWPVQSAEQGIFAWIRTGAETPEALFLLGRSRGKGNIDNLRGEGARNQPGLTDAYPAYTNAFTVHALCWAHPHRAFRDIAAAECLSEVARQHCQDTFQIFDALYADVRTVNATPFVLKERLLKKAGLAARFDEIVAPHPLDPKKLAARKATLRENRECYFVCIIRPGIPCDNNKAERGLRHLVIKRRISCGSRTQRGADMMSVLYSVLLSLWWKSKPAFFQEYARLLSP
jgi:transposase